jgi:hypothetical protein
MFDSDDHISTWDMQPGLNLQYQIPNLLTTSEEGPGTS